MTRNLWEVIRGVSRERFYTGQLHPIVISKLYPIIIPGGPKQKVCIIKNLCKFLHSSISAKNKPSKF